MNKKKQRGDADIGLIAIAIVLFAIFFYDFTDDEPTLREAIIYKLTGKTLWMSDD